VPTPLLTSNKSTALKERKVHLRHKTLAPLFGAPFCPAVPAPTAVSPAPDDRLSSHAHRSGARATVRTGFRARHGNDGPQVDLDSEFSLAPPNQKCQGPVG